MDICCDIDGVVRDLIPEIKKEYRRCFPGHVIVSGESEYWTLNSLFPNAIFDVLKWSFEKEHVHVFFDAKPYNGSVEALRTLASLGHNLYYITDQSKLSKYETLKWIAEYNLPIKGIIFEGEKHKIKLYGADIFIDDSPSVICGLMKRFPMKKIYMINKKYNGRLIDEGVVNKENCFNSLKILVNKVFCNKLENKNANI